MSALAKLPSNLQRAALAVTHIENVTLEEVVPIAQRVLRETTWVTEVDDFVVDIRRLLRLKRDASGKVVSLAAVRMLRRGACL